MYIAYSALHSHTRHPENNSPETPDHELLLRYQAYQNVCSKYHREIAAIQKYLPNWKPKFY